MPVRTEKETLEKFSRLVEQAKKDGNNKNQAYFSALNAMGIQDEAARNRLVWLYSKRLGEKEKKKNPINEWWEEFKVRYAGEIEGIGRRDAGLQ
ncbi:MAG: hypothetical protein AAB513_03365 [Patescibacteria group bacterium]